MPKEIYPYIMPELPLRDLEILNSQPLIQQVAALLEERGHQVETPMIAEVAVHNEEGKQAVTALIFPLENGCTIEITRYWWSQQSLHVIGRKERVVKATSTPILNEEISDPENGILKRELDSVLKVLLS